MKKTSLANLIIVIGLLVLCVMTLIAVYATEPSVLLLDETFSHLDGSKWRNEISECEEGSEFSQYDIEDRNTSKSMSNGGLNICSNLTNVKFRNKKEAFNNCTSCLDSKYLGDVCDSSLLVFTKVQTKDGLIANRGRIKMRAKLQSRRRMKFCIEITSKFNDSESAEVSAFESEISASNITKLEIFLKSISNETITKSEIIDSEFHIYEINWNCKKISLKIDNKEVEEKQFKVSHLEEKNDSNTTMKLNSAPISQPLYLKVGIKFEENELSDSRNHSEYEKYFNESQKDLEDDNVFEIDYIQLFKI